MKTKLFLFTLLVIFAISMGGCRSCSSSPGDNSNVNATSPTPLASPITTPTLSPPASPTPVPVTGIPECDDLFAKFEIWAAEKNKNGSKTEKIAVAGLKITLIGPIKNKISKMKPGDRDKLAGQCSLAAVQFERKQRALETNANTAK